LTAQHANAEPIRRAFDAFASGDMATMQSLVAEDTVWHIPGRGPLAGDHRGRDAVFEIFGRLVQASEGTFNQAFHDL
jgi:ketosteroid isomerase-like protein